MASNRPLVYAVAITYDGRRFLEGCLRTLLATDYDNLRVLLVINGSSDGSEDFVRQTFPEVELLVLPSNIGCLPACNQGLATALERGAEYVVLCNDDIEVLDQRWLSESTAIMQNNPTMGIVGYLEYINHDAVLPDEVKAQPVKHVAFFAALMRGEMLRQLGLFDLEFTMYAGEDDLILRSRRAGYAIVQLNVPFLHFGGGTTTHGDPRTGYMQIYSSLHLCIKHHGPLRLVAKVMRMLDVACNPWPLSMDRNDHAHVRMRNRGNVFLNGWLILQALGRNIWQLRPTLKRRRVDLEKARQARRRLKRETLQLPITGMTHFVESSNSSSPVRARDGCEIADIQQPSIS